MKAKIAKVLKITAIGLILTGSISTCWQEDIKEEISPCDKSSINARSIPPWVYEFIVECLENDFFGEMFWCDYIDDKGIDCKGFLLESYEKNGSVYSFLTCEGIVLDERVEEKAIERSENAFPELKITKTMFLVGKYHGWEQEEKSDEFLCNTINPFTLPLVKEMIYRCGHFRCDKVVYICPYRDGVGFVMHEHLNTGHGVQSDFLDCNGNLLCNIHTSGEYPFVEKCPELNIEYNKYDKLIRILSLGISLNVN